MVKFKDNLVKLKERFESEYDFKSLIQNFFDNQYHQIICGEEVYQIFL